MESRMEASDNHLWGNGGPIYKMGISINTNLDALTATRNLGMNQRSFSTAVNRLSSGLRINVAADDAAGLSISEKLRAQARGLRQAVRNSQDGISLIQVAEGALNETSAILQRMRELAIQAKNGTLSTEDSNAVRLEIVELEEEIDRIADTTQFNGKLLLNGAFQQSVLSPAAASEIKSDEIASSNPAALSSVYRGVSVTDPAVALRPYTLSGAGAAGVTMTGHITVAGSLVTLTQVVTVAGSGGTTAAGDKFGFNFSVFGISFELENVSSVALTDISMAAAVNGDTLTVAATAGASSNMVLQIGANANQVATISLVDSRAQSLGGTVGSYTSIENLVSSLSSSNMGDLADELISMVDLAMLDVNENRSSLGANQNRLNYTINNLTVGAENMTASESRIRDADIAWETVNFIKAQILQQAGIAVMAQANQAPQTVLALLR